MDEAMLTSSVGCEASMDVFFLSENVLKCAKRQLL